MERVPDFAALWHKLRERVPQNGLELVVEPAPQRWFSRELEVKHHGLLKHVSETIGRTTLEGHIGPTAACLGLDQQKALPKIESATLRLSAADDALDGPRLLMDRLAITAPEATHRSVPGAAPIAKGQDPAGVNLAHFHFLKGREAGVRATAA